MSFAYSPINLGGGGTSTVSSTLVTNTLGVTVAASGADYTSIGAALAGAQTIINIIGNTTESGIMTLNASGLHVSLNNNATLALGNYSFSVPTDAPLAIDGRGLITFGNTTGGTLFSGSGALSVEDITIQNTGTNIVCMTDMNYAMFDSVRYIGDIYVCGDFNIFNDGIHRNGNFIFQPSANKSALLGAILETVLVIDSGTNSVVADLMNG